MYSLLKSNTDSTTTKMVTTTVESTTTQTIMSIAETSTTTTPSNILVLVKVVFQNKMLYFHITSMLSN